MFLFFPGQFWGNFRTLNLHTYHRNPSKVSIVLFSGKGRQLVNWRWWNFIPILLGFLVHSAFILSWIPYSFKFKCFILNWCHRWWCIKLRIILNCESICHMQDKPVGKVTGYGLNGQGSGTDVGNVIFSSPPFPKWQWGLPLHLVFMCLGMGLYLS